MIIVMFTLLVHTAYLTLKMITCACGQQTAQSCANQKCRRCCNGTTPCERFNKRKIIDEHTFDNGMNFETEEIEEFYAENDSSYNDLQIELHRSCTALLSWDIVQYIICDFLDERDRCVECGKAAWSSNFCCDRCHELFCDDWRCTEIYTVGKHSLYCSDCYRETRESEEE